MAEKKEVKPSPALTTALKTLMNYQPPATKSPAGGKWLPLSVHNDWEHETVYFGKPKKDTGWDTLTPLDKPGRYKIMWPCGVQEEVEVTMVPYTRDYHDMGHVYQASGKRPWITITHYGAKLKLLLTDTGCKVFLPDA